MVATHAGTRISDITGGIMGGVVSGGVMRLARQAGRRARRAAGLPADHIHPAIPDGATVLIHVGKSGGTSLRTALKASDLGASLHTVHIRRPPIRPSLRYYIVARGPVSRALSAFNWRHKLVVEDGVQADRIAGERAFLQRHGTLDALGRALYAADGTPDRAAIEGFSRLHHIRENIAFYLDPLLDRIDPAQVAGVLMQENLDADIARVFGVDPGGRRDKSHGGAVDPARKHLSPEALANLRRYFTRDYACLLRLFCWGKIDRDVYARTL